VGQPDDAAGCAEGDGEEIDAPDAVRKFPMPHQKRLGGREQAARLDCGNRLFGGAESFAPARFDFDEDHHVSIAHDQVDFTVGTSPIRGDEPVASLFEMTARVSLAGSAETLAD
jgi:hypothetical protein